MKKLALALVAVTAAFTAGSATAADLGPCAVQQSPPAGYCAGLHNWTGFWISGGFGYGLMDV